MVADVDQGALDAAVARLQRQGVTAAGARCDVSSGEEVRAAVAAAERDLGGIDICVANAGAVYLSWWCGYRLWVVWFMVVDGG